jgi:hypothetical protein
VTTPRWLRLALGCALGTFLFAGCGEEPDLDLDAVESYLAESQAATFGSEAEIGEAACKSGNALEEGMTLRCALAVSDASVPYLLTLHDVHSPEVSVDVALEAVVLRAADVGDFVRRQLPKAFRQAGVDCGGDYLVTDVGETVECTVSSGAQSQPVTVTVEDEEGHVSIS